MLVFINYRNKVLKQYSTKQEVQMSQRNRATLHIIQFLDVKDTKISHYKHMHCLYPFNITLTSSLFPTLTWNDLE